MKAEIWIRGVADSIKIDGIAWCTVDELPALSGTKWLAFLGEDKLERCRFQASEVLGYRAMDERGSEPRSVGFVRQIAPCE